MSTETQVQTQKQDHVWQDEQGRKWVVRLDVFGVRAVREHLGMDLADLGQAADNMVKLSNDPCLLCNVLFLLCEEQAKLRNVTDEDFGRLLLGDTIYDATLALEAAIVNFFPQQKRLLLQRLRKKVDQVEGMGLDLVSERLEDVALTDKIQQGMRAKMQAMIQSNLMELNSVSISPEPQA